MNKTKALIIALRPRSWAKNGVVVAGWFDSGRLLDGSAALVAATVFVLLSILSSATYLINDVFDRRRDRLHPTNRFRPVASGALPVPTALAAAVLLAILAIMVGWLIGPTVAASLAAFLLLQLVYSAYLKHVPFADAISVATGFTVRLVITTAALHAPFSPWLTIACFFASMFMLLSKRRFEVANLTDEERVYRPALAAYRLSTLDQAVSVFTACGIVFYAIYTILNPHTPSLVITLPFLAYGILRYHHVVGQPKMAGAGHHVFTMDWPIILNTLIWMLVAAGLIIATRR